MLHHACFERESALCMLQARGSIVHVAKKGVHFACFKQEGPPLAPQIGPHKFFHLVTSVIPSFSFVIWLRRSVTTIIGRLLSVWSPFIPVFFPILTLFIDYTLVEGLNNNFIIEGGSCTTTFMCLISTVLSSTPLVGYTLFLANPNPNTR